MTGLELKRIVRLKIGILCKGTEGDLRLETLRS